MLTKASFRFWQKGSKVGNYAFETPGANLSQHWDIRYLLKNDMRRGFQKDAPIPDCSIKAE